jgi:xanthine/uracil permease
VGDPAARFPFLKGGRGWMKIKGFIWNMILGGFLGFLWIIFSERVVDIANSFQSPWLLGGLIIVIGTLLFGEVYRRAVNHQGSGHLRFKHLPASLSFGLVVVIYFLISP